MFSMMKGLLITEKGMEQTALQEIIELISAEASASERVVVFEAKSYEQLFRLCYLSQSAYKVLALFNTFSIKNTLDKDLASIKKAIDSADYGNILPKKFSFRVNCQRIGEQEYNSLDIDREAGAMILEHFKCSSVVMESPDIIFYLFINENTGYFGLDLSGTDLSKRAYKIFNHPQALKGPVGFHLLKMAEVKAKDVILDPFCGSGVIPIEAAICLKGFPVRFYNKEFQFLKLKKIDAEKFFKSIDSKIKKTKPRIFCFDKEFHYVNAAKKNAKIAGIDKDIEFSRLDIEWLDTKFDKESVDRIITNPPRASFRTDVKLTEKTYNEFFYQAEFVLKKNGHIIMICDDSTLLKKCADNKGFRLHAESDIWSGSKQLNVLEFRKDLNTKKRNR